MRAFQPIQGEDVCQMKVLLKRRLHKTTCKNQPANIIAEFISRKCTSFPTKAVLIITFSVPLCQDCLQPRPGCGPKVLADLATGI